MWFRCFQTLPPAPTAGSPLASSDVPGFAFYNGGCVNFADWNPYDPQIACTAFRYITDGACEFWNEVIGGNPLFGTTSGPGGICEPTWDGSLGEQVGILTLINAGASRLLDRPWSTTTYNPPGESFGGTPLDQVTASLTHLICEYEFCQGLENAAASGSPPESWPAGA